MNALLMVAVLLAQSDKKEPPKEPAKEPPKAVVTPLPSPPSPIVYPCPQPCPQPVVVYYYQPVCYQPVYQNHCCLGGFLRNLFCCGR